MKLHVHCTARRQHDDPFVRLERASEAFEHLLRIVLESRIGGRLTAARRAVWNGNAHTETLEHTQRRNRNMRIELIDEARNEERDARHAIRS